MGEVEVEATQILHKKIKLRASSGSLFTGVLSVFECESPFCLIFQVSTENEHAVRLDVFREDLARELREWLNGKIIRFPALLITQSIEESMSLFVRFQQTPPQVDLIMWVLSRCEISFGSNPVLKFGSDKGKEGGSEPVASSGRGFSGLQGRGLREASSASASSADNYDRFHLRNDFPLTAAEASKSVSRSLSAGDSQQRQTGMVTRQSSEESGRASVRSVKLNSSSGVPLNRRSGELDDDLKTYSTTRKLLGKSVALSTLSKHSIKGRQSSGTVYDTKSWSSDHFRLVADLERARKDIEASMEERRRVIEVSKARQKQASDRYGTIRDKVKEASSLNTWLSTAAHELETYTRMQTDIETEILKQKGRAQRACQYTRWTIAPNGFSNRRGKSERGPYMGAGPLPAEATSKPRDPRLEATIKHYYWDSYGRRHDRVEHDEVHSPVELALEAIRRASQNISTYKLDLKDVFDHFDVNDDGRISIKEMEEVFSHLGVQLDEESLEAIFHHFDPNGSGWVDFGEFQWAFFNRRSLIRKWERSISDMTEEQIEARFHAADTNGDDQLNFKEFSKLLVSFNVILSEAEREQLFARFDTDGDGKLDLEEFIRFVKTEQEHLHLRATKKPTTSNERKWNNSVTYKVDLAKIASQQAKREKGRLEREARRQARSQTPPPPSYRGRARDTPNGANRPSSAGSSRPSSADSRSKGAAKTTVWGRPKSPASTWTGAAARPRSPSNIWTRPRSNSAESGRSRTASGSKDDGDVGRLRSTPDSQLTSNRSASTLSSDNSRRVSESGRSTAPTPAHFRSLSNATAPTPLVSLPRVDEDDAHSEATADKPQLSATTPEISSARDFSLPPADKPQSGHSSGSDQRSTGGRPPLAQSRGSSEGSKSRSHGGRDADSAGQSEEDVTWLVRMLKAQAEIENRLGHEYY